MKKRNVFVALSTLLLASPLYGMEGQRIVCNSPETRLVFQQVGSTYTARSLTYQGKDVLGPNRDARVDSDGALIFRDGVGRTMFFREYRVESHGESGYKFKVLADQRGMNYVLEEGSCMPLQGFQIEVTERVCDSPFRSMGEVQQLRLAADKTLESLQAKCTGSGGSALSRDRIESLDVSSSSICMTITASAGCQP